MQAYLHFGFDNEPRRTVRVEARYEPMPHHIAGKTWTASGYGSRIPSATMVKWEGRWRRVYVVIYGNSGTAYLGKPGAWLCTVDSDD